MITKKLAQYILNKATSTGADFAEIYFENTLNKSISVVNGVVENLVSSQTYGVGIRLLKDTKSVYGYTNDLSKNNLEKLVERLIGSFNENKIINFFIKNSNTNYH